MRYRQKVAAVYLLVFFIDLINMFIANVAYAGIGRYFDASVSTLAWIGNGYLLGLTLVIPVSPWLGQRFGPKRVFIASLLIFMAGTVGAGCAPSLAALIGWRFIQGAGGGMLIPLGQAMTYRHYPRDERASLSAVIMLVGLMAPALSPAFGGWIIDLTSWRWAFLATLPLAVLALGMAMGWLTSSPAVPDSKRLDGMGLLQSCTAIVLLLLGLTTISEPRTFMQGGMWLLAGVALLCVYVRSAWRQPQPLIDLRLMRDPLLRISMLIYQFIPGMFTGVNLLAVLYFQECLGMSAAHVGLLMVPWSLASFVAITLTGKLFNRLGPRPLFMTGCLMQGIGIGLLVCVDGPWIQLVAAACFMFMGFGGSLCSSTAQSSAFLQMPDHQLADASALWNINRQLSFCFGIAVMSALFNLLTSSLNLEVGQAYHLCFLMAAFSVVIPALCCCRIANRSIISQMKGHA